MDARQTRTRERLYAAVLELAAETRAEDLTVTAIAEAAGVHRSTVYEWAASPSDLLRQALEAELDEVRARYLTGVGPDSLPGALRDVTRAVLQHMLSHREIYRRGLAQGGALHDFLSAHFQESSRLLYPRGLWIAVDASGVSRDVIDNAARRYVADGTVGAIAEWLEDPGEPEDFLTVLAQLSPPWWPVERRK